jgi:hypothetical protein
MSHNPTERNHSGGGQRRHRRSRGGRGRHSNQGNRSQQRKEFRPQSTSQKTAPLSWWQRFLIAIGFKKQPGTKPAPQRSAQAQATPSRKQEAPRANTRVARTPDSETAPGKAAPPQGVVDSPRLYVGNLSYDATESDLEDLFKGFGSVRSVEIVYNRRTHVSKGYAFVELHHLDDAKRAVEVLHDQPFMGRKLIVNSAKSRGANDDAPDGEPEGSATAASEEAA